MIARSAFPNVKVTNIDVSDPHDIEKPFVTQIVASAADFASPKGAGLRFSPFGQRQSFVESWAQLSKRVLPERLPSPQKTVIEAQVELPKGWTATLPEGARETGPQGSYEAFEQFIARCVDAGPSYCAFAAASAADTRARFDALMDRLRTDFPDAYAACVSAGGSRRFNLVKQEKTS